MRTHGVLGGIVVGLSVLVGACAGATANRPGRQPAASRPVEATFACDGERVVLTEDSVGPALLVGDRELENHWRADGADHFVTWEYRGGRHLALEYEISADRTTVTRREYDRKAGAAYQVTASANGVWRVDGRANATLPCAGPAIAARTEASR